MTIHDPSLPEYEVDEASRLPTYSPQAASTECLLQLEPPRRTGCPACEWIFETKHFRINLGRKMWKLNSPTYGLHGRIDGSIELLDPACNVESIQATIEGRLKISCSDRRVPVENSLFLSQSFDIPYDPELPETSFSIPIPAFSGQEGKKVRAPPSFYFSEANYVVEVAYYCRFNLSWKNKKRRKSDSRLIGFYYLPKTSPIAPPICDLPPASRHRENPPLFLQSPDRISSFPIPPTLQIKGQPTPYQAAKLKGFRDAVYLSLPNPTTYTSGQEMPFMLSLSFHDDPYMADLLCESVAIHLYKRIGVVSRNTKDGGSEYYNERNVLVSSATLRKNSGWAEGVIVLKGEIQTGSAGAETSWSLPENAHVKYIFRISLRPPPNLAAHVPAFIHEEEINICTSSWGTVEREFLSGGGCTTPAVGLASSLRRIY